MKKIIFVMALLILVGLVGTVSAENFIFKQFDEIDLKIACFDENNNYCNASVECNLTVLQPNHTAIVNNQVMDYNTAFYNYTLDSGLMKAFGEHSVITICTGNTTGFSTFTYEVNPVGLEMRSVLDNPIFLILFIMALGLLVMGIHFASPPLGFIGSIVFILSGVYTMLYGFGNITNLYTRGVAISIIGIGLIFLFSSAYEWFSWGNKEEE